MSVAPACSGGPGGVVGARPEGRRQTDRVSSPTGQVPPGNGAGPADARGRRGVIRLLNTAGGRVLCLAGEVDAATVDAFRERYGAEPARVERIETGSVTWLSGPALELLREHLAAAEQAGRSVVF